MISKIYKVKLDKNNYKIFIGEDIIINKLTEILKEKTKNTCIALLYDTIFKDKINNIINTLSQLGYNVYPHALKSGKHNKNIKEVIKVYKLLESNNFSRDSTIIALGGGVIGDLSGFVASTYFRGINLIHIPTTLTAMIDSSIGGKVAINFENTINAIGNYYHPIANIVELKFLETLPERDFRSGIAEIIKCAIITDKRLFNYLDKNTTKILNHEKEALLHIMSRAIKIKLKHVSGDVREGNKRLKLNYGHTLGQSIEISTDKPKELFRHGEGVALGMIGAAFIAKEFLQQDETVLKSHENILNKYQLPTKINSKEIGLNKESLVKKFILNTYKDKKRKNNKLRFILPKKIGKSSIYQNISEEFINKAFEYLVEDE